MTKINAAHLVSLFAVMVSVSASAQERSASQHEVLVADSGGEFAVRVSPAILTSLFFPEPIVGALPSDSRNFSIKKLGSNALAIRPLTAKKGLRASVAITTKTMRITVLLTVVTDDPHGMVTFKKKSVAVGVAALLLLAAMSALRPLFAGELLDRGIGEAGIHDGNGSPRIDTANVAERGRGGRGSRRASVDAGGSGRRRGRRLRVTRASHQHHPATDDT